jgi:hypothetical protein
MDFLRGSKGDRRRCEFVYVIFFFFFFYSFSLFLNNCLLFFCLNFVDYVNGRKDGELIVLGERNLLHIFLKKVKCFCAFSIIP